METRSIVIVFPENRKELDNSFLKHLALYFKELRVNELEDLFKIQTDSSVLCGIKKRLLSVYAEDLEKDNENFAKLHRLILGCNLSMSEKRETLFSVRREAIQTHLSSFKFSKLVGMYSIIMENEDDYSTFVVDAFAPILVGYVSKSESVHDIQKACISYNDYSWEKIGMEIEKKLGMKFAE